MATIGTIDSWVQVAVDSTGKKVLMLQGVDAAGNIVHVQAAQIIGEVPELLGQIAQSLKENLAATRMLTAILSESSNSRAEEEDYFGRDPRPN